MKYTADKLIEELYNSDPNYQQYSIEEFGEMCLTPLAFFKKRMKEPTLPSMRFKYLGLFVVYPGVIAKMLHYNQARYDKGIVTQDTYEAFKAEMEEVHRQLTSQTYKRGKVTIIYNDEPSASSNTLQEEQEQAV